MDPAVPEDEIHLSSYIATVIENWRIICAIAAFGLLIGLIYIVLVQPVYRADALIQVEDNANATKDALGEIASIFDTKQTAAAEIEIIRSRLVVDQAVDALHLDIKVQPRYFPLIGAFWARRVSGGEVGAAPFGLGKFAWGGEEIDVSRFVVPDADRGVQFTLVIRGADEYDVLAPDGMHVLRGKAGVLAKGRSASGPVELMVGRLVGRPGTEFAVTRRSTLQAVRELRDALSISELTKQSGMIGLSLEGGDRKLAANIVNSIARVYVQQNIDRKSAEAEHTLKFLDQQLPKLREELDKAEERYNTFRKRNGTVDLPEESRFLLQQIVDAKAKLIDLQQQRVVMIQRFAPTHPSVQALDGQIDILQRQLAEQDKRVATLPDTEQSALRLLRDVKVDTELYTNLLDSAQQLRIVKAGQVGNVRVIDYAVVPELPIKPHKSLVVALATVVGLIAGIAAAFVKKTLFGGVEHSEEIERVLGVPVYAVVPRSGAQTRMERLIDSGAQGLKVLAALTPSDPAVEGVRSLRTALRFGMLEASNNVVMITGPRPDVGKTFFSSNLAVVLAAGGQRVLLIEADIRRGNLRSHFGLSPQRGLADAIAGSDIDSTITKNVVPGLDVLLNGSELPPNPAELLMSNRFQELIETLSTRYDIVLVDTPPVLAVTDTALIGRWAGTALLTARYGQTPMQELIESVKRLNNSGISVNGVLLTDVPQRFGYYGAYYAGYYRYEGQAQ